MNKTLSLLGTSIALGAGLVMTAGPAMAAHAASTPMVGQETVTPHSDLVNAQLVNVTYSGFGTESGTAYVFECTPGVLTDPNNAANYCDEAAGTAGMLSNGSGEVTNYPVQAGAGFSAGSKSSKCDYAHSCYIVVSDSTTSPTYASFAQVTFKDTRAATKTKLSGSKSGKAGHKVKLTATTKHGRVSSSGGSASVAPSGKVIFKDNGKKVAKVSEPANGKAKAHIKLEAGKNKITASYSGDSNFKPSSAKATVKGKAQSAGSRG